MYNTPPPPQYFFYHNIFYLLCPAVCGLLYGSYESLSLCTGAGSTQEHPAPSNACIIDYVLPSLAFKPCLLNAQESDSLVQPPLWNHVKHEGYNISGKIFNQYVKNVCAWVVFTCEGRDVPVGGVNVWRSPAQGLFSNFTSKEHITSNKRRYDCDLHCFCSGTKHNEHSSSGN